MESSNSVRNRLRAAAPEADDRALYEDLLAEQEERAAARAYAVASGPVERVSTRPVLDAVLAAVVRSAYQVDAAARYARSKPLTTLAVAAGIGAVLARLLKNRR